MNSVFFRAMPDKQFLKMKYWIKIGKILNLSEPNSFNEKMQWLKLNDRKEEYSLMADKVEAKKYVSNVVGKKYIIPTLGVYNVFDEINFDELPEQFVIKTTHDSSGSTVCLDKEYLDMDALRNKINASLKTNYYYHSREWPYKNIRPRIIIEKYVKDDVADDLRDYKFMCFNGIPKYVYVTVKNNNIFENYYDMDFRPVGINHGFPRIEPEFKKPSRFNEMKNVAKKLSRGIPFLRVDLHFAGGKVLFGEMTFYDWGGFRPFADEKWDYFLGDMIKLDLDKGDVV